MITKEVIFAAADELNANGTNPTLAAVRKKIGNRGSFTTISEFMQEWRASKEVKAKTNSDPVPQELADRIAILGADVWSVAIELATGRFLTEKASLESARLQLEKEKTEALTTLDDLALEIVSLKTRISTLEEAKMVLCNEIENERSQATAHAERAAVADARVCELEKRAEDLSTQLSHVNSHNAELVSSLAKLSPY